MRSSETKEMRVWVTLLGKPLRSIYKTAGQGFSGQPGQSTAQTLCTELQRRGSQRSGWLALGSKDKSRHPLETPASKSHRGQCQSISLMQRACSSCTGQGHTLIRHFQSVSSGLLGRTASWGSCSVWWPRLMKP